MEFILFIVIIVGFLIFNKLLKLIFYCVCFDFYWLIEINGYSFLSGYVMSVFVVYGVFLFLIWCYILVCWGWIFLMVISIIMIVVIGISCIYLGVYYFSDVIGGYFVSGCWLVIVIWFY